MIATTKNLLVGLFLIVYTTSSAQIVTLNPAFPTRTEEVTITYDAKQGNKGLVGTNPVYAHMGLTVEGKTGWQYVIGDWGKDDARVKMTSIGNDVHTLKIRINDFYKVPLNEKIQKLNFVFRNLNGSKEGKTATNQDIFIDYLDGAGQLVSSLESPKEKSLIVPIGEQIPILLNASRSTRILMTSNGSTIYDAVGTQLKTNLQVNTQGKKDIVIKVGEGAEQKIFEFTYDTPPTVSQSPVPANTVQGYNRVQDNKATFVLSAPQKQYVHLLSSLNGWKLSNDYALKQSPDGTKWWITVDVPDGITDISYQYLIDGKILVADPFSELVLDPSNDRFISSSNFPNILVYPTDKTTGIVSWARVTKPSFAWTDANYKRPKKERLNVYELLVRDFVETQSYKSLKDTLDYLQRMGINAIEIMPIQEFEGNESWGYNPSFHMALDKAYGTPEQFKAFVNEAHKRGIAIIQDVVFNHAFSQSPLVQMYLEGGKPSANSPYANVDAKHPFNVGFDLNHESTFMQAYMDQILKYWVTEYHIDGFRFDLSKGFTQTANTDVGAWSRFDAGRIALLKRMADELWKLDPQNIIVLEHFADNTEERELTNYGMLVWGNNVHNFNEGTMGYVESGKSDVSNLDYRKRSFTKPGLLSYMESHDEERLAYKNSQFGKVGASHNTKEKEVYLARMSTAAHAFLGVPGSKMIWQFGELGYEFSINRCTNGSISNDCRLAPKPIRWDYLQDASRYNVYKAYATMNALRNRHEVFHTNDFTWDARDGYKVLTLNGDTLDAVVITNFDVVNQFKNVVFSHSGVWHELYTGSTIDVGSSNTAPITLKPGEYRVYFDKRINIPSLVITSTSKELASEINIYPNPVQHTINLDYGLDIAVDKVALFSPSGQLVKTWESPNSVLDIAGLENGSYFIQLQTNKGVLVKSIVVIK